MKFNKLAIVTALMLGVACGVQAADEDPAPAPAPAKDQGHGRITFTGAIIDAPCSIDPNSVDQTVELGSISNITLANSGNSEPKPFEIRLEKCSLATAKNVKTTFDGPAGAGGLLGITGDASGASIAITDGNGTQVVMGTATAGQLISVGATNATLAFSAYLKGNGGAADTINPGAFNSVANFMLSYN
ncbi:Pilin (type 1 fimbria component protein) [Pseudomonas sp. NFPP10]|uniref:fimbrial protein n=1 Tax=Pseudomonas TaxID=286 RepID=UPI000887C41B|nr:MULTISPECIES: fimbrial protein [Pseudomonas]POA89896.1 fimbria A protein [Pseudomonas protegens]PZP09638.1 MAG: fimbria A protein [Pseudomonas protegens]SDA21307.1 Pilin (type 1 fimbria component protein) [Pseudomonas sp. NFPP12]SEL35693.1 Pilin (type 1 fimbria component protein) [Pseudomonas sp. NFPP10]SEQ20917.1 Pilin (type 1 fimbria component protein) [Pseudomonas sp. NFPP19]